MTDPKSENESVSDSQINEPVSTPVEGRESSTESSQGGSGLSSQGKKSGRSSNHHDDSAAPAEGQKDESATPEAEGAKDATVAAETTGVSNPDAETADDVADESEATTPPSTKVLMKGYKNLRVAVLIAVVIIGLLGFFLISRGNSGANLDKIQGKVALSEQELRDVVASNHLTVFWAGPVSGDKYALMASNPSVIYVRYLPGGVGTNDFKTPFRTVGTYVQKNAFAVAKYTGKTAGNIGMTNADGNAVFYSPARDTNVYIGIKGKDIQIEVYDPAGGQALGLVLIKSQIRQIM